MRVALVRLMATVFGRSELRLNSVDGIRRCGLALMLALGWFSQIGASSEPSYYSPPTRSEYPARVYWGDTHLHTTLSVDSAGRGNEVVTPDVAYRFARGDKVRASTGEAFKLDRPLDFLVIADHGVNMGVVDRVQAGDPLVLNTPTGRKWREIWDRYGWSVGEKLRSESFEEWQDAVSRVGVNSAEPEAFFWQAWNDDYVDDPRFRRSVWDEVCGTADRHYDPGVFTAFIGYEWTPAGSNPRAPFIHRVVVFKGDGSQACQVLPFTAQDSSNVERLWDYLDDYESRTGDQVLAIPHNANMTGGMMFAPINYDGEPLTRSYLETRQRWEPLLEVTQIKGTSETHPLLSPTDEFADFEIWPFGNDQLTEEVAQYGYARSALRLGLQYQADQGVNPFKFGMIGSSDSHTGLSAIAEDNFTGNFPMIEPTRHRARGASWFSASGLAAVWATDNTRPALFAAMKRREVYATTGSRITVRFFGGYDFSPDDPKRPDFVEIGYSKGVPMGADLIPSNDRSVPTFMVHAAKDPIGANLDRVQIVKGWLDASGETHEKIFDVALSGGRMPGRDGSVVPVGSTVDVDAASYTNAIGAPELAAVWTDPEFDATEHAFYYVRVLEIPTPRWTTYDAQFFETDLDSVPERVPTMIQERAYTSPIWFTP